MRPLIALILAASLASPALTRAQQPGAPPAQAAKPADLAKELPNAHLFLAITNRSLADVRFALKEGADPNARNWLTLTPLMWASFQGELEIAKELVRRGARVNDDCIYGSALAQAAQGRQEKVSVFLLEHGARPDPPRYDRTSPLMVAAETGNLGLMRALIAHHAKVNYRNADGATALIFAARGGHVEALRLLLASGAGSRAAVSAADSLKRTPLHYAALSGCAPAVQALLAHGAAPNAVDATGFSPLHLAARYSGDAETVRALVRAGASVTMRDARGKTAYDCASRRGYVAAATLLRRGMASAAPTSGTVTVAYPAPDASANETRRAVTAALTSIQKGMTVFHAKSVCASCHHQGLGLITLGHAARHKLPVDGKLMGLYFGRLEADGKAGAEAMHAAAMDPKFHPLATAVDIGDFSSGAGYLLGAPLACGAPPNPGFAEGAVVLAQDQRADGGWKFASNRGAMENSFFTTTAMVLDVLNGYYPADRKAVLDAKKAKAVQWLTSTKPRCAEDLTSRVWALKAAGATDAQVASAARMLVAAQRSDGGWGGAPTGGSDAHATGMALYVLRNKAGMDAGSPVIRKGVAFLLRTQDEDGTWYMPKRTPAYNNHFDAAFPHGYMQYASFAGTCWAAMGLMETLDGEAGKSARR